MTIKPKSKTAQLLAEREARKAEKAALRAENARQLEAIRNQAVSLCSRMPPQFHAWGVTRTRAYANMLAITRRKAALKNIKVRRLASFVHALQSVEAWPLSYCQQLADLPERAAQLPEFIAD
jgi:hypothetical protein